MFQFLLKPNLITCLDKVKLKLPSWEDGKTLEISTITVHPHFNDSSYDNDLAVLTLAAAVDLTQLRPICLPSPGTEVASSRAAMVSGTKTLASTSATLISNTECQKFWREDHISLSHLCSWIAGRWYYSAVSLILSESCCLSSRKHQRDLFSGYSRRKGLV